MLYQIIAVRKEIEIFKYLRNNFKYLVLGVVMFLVVVPLKNIIYSDWRLIIVQVITGAVIYLTGFTIIQMIELKEYNIVELFKKVLSKYNIN